MILIASALFPPEPVVSANIAFDLASKLAEEYDVTVISPTPSRPYGVVFSSPAMSTNFIHHILKSYTHPQSSIVGRFFESYSLGLHIKRFIERYHKKIEVVYANVWPLFAQYSVAKVCLKYNIPFVVHVQDIYPESLTNKIPVIGGFLRQLILPIDKFILSSADLVVCISKQMKNELVSTRKISKDKISIVRNWQDDNIFEEEKNSISIRNNEQFTFLYLGSINPTAEVSLLIKAFSKANLYKAKLVIAGSGSDKNKCVRLASVFKGNIIFADAKPQQVAGIQSVADVLLLPLRKGVAATALPSKMTAYMLSGKPILASVDEPSEIASIIKENQCGWVTSPGNIDELSLSMKEAYDSDREKLTKIGNNSLSFAKLNLSKEINLNLLRGIVESVKEKI